MVRRQLIETSLPDYWTPNPLHMVKTHPLLPPKSRGDMESQGKLVVGEGGSAARNSGTSRNVDARGKRYLMFQAAGQHLQSMNPNVIDADNLLKHKQVQECERPREQHLSCPPDDVRVSAKDGMYYCFNGKLGSGYPSGWGLRVALLKSGSVSPCAGPSRLPAYWLAELAISPNQNPPGI